MKNFRHFFAVLCAAALMLPVFGCGDSDDDVVPAPEALKLVPSETQVHTGTEVTFKVFNGDTDVTDRSQIRNVKTNEYLHGAFVPESAGNYRFVAELDDRVSEKISVAVIGTFKPEGKFYRQVLVQKFTGTWCGYCPMMTAALEKLDGEVPGRMTIMAVHVNDSFSVSDGEKLATDYKISSIPKAVFDYRFITTYGSGELAEALQTEINDYPSVCGVALESTVEDNRIYVDAKIRFSEAGQYRVCCAVIEDGLRYSGGTSSDGYYQHALRKYATSRTGEDIGYCEAGVEYPCSYTIPVGDKWTVQNCKVLVYVMKMDKVAGSPYYTNNVASCNADKGSSEYRYEAE